MKSFSYVQLFVTPWTVAYQVSLSVGFSRQEYWSGLLFLRGIFPTQGSNPGLPHCRRILYRLNHQGSPHLFSCRNKMRKYRPHSAPVCLLVTLANWNLAQVHGAQTYRDDFIFLDKFLKKSIHFNFSFTMSGQGPVCVFFSDLGASIW